MNEEIRKRRDAYKNLAIKNLDNSLQTPKIYKSTFTQEANIIPNTTEENISKSSTPMANIKISSVTPI